MPEADVIVVGSGIIGSFSAFHLAKRGLRPIVLDRNGLAAGTSRASDGNLLLSDHPVGLGLDLMRDSLRLWGEMIEEVGNDCEYDPKGSLLVTHDPRQAARLRAHVEAQAAIGVACEFHDEGLAEFEPLLAPEICGLGYWMDDAQVQPMLACYQMARWLRDRGVAYRLYDELADFAVSATSVTVTLGSGERLSAGRLCFCTGVWTPALLAPLGIRLPLQPRKGQICVLERGELAIRRKIMDFAYNNTVEQADPEDSEVQTAAVIEATRSGTILCGSSREFAGFERSVEPQVLARIMRDCIAIIPKLKDLRMIRGYAGLRPYSPDGMPMIGPVDDRERVFVATGHEGSGHGLAAVSGHILADLVSGMPNRYAEPLDPRRFWRQ